MRTKKIYHRTFHSKKIVLLFCLMLVLQISKATTGYTAFNTSTTTGAAGGTINEKATSSAGGDTLSTGQGWENFQFTSTAFRGSTVSGVALCVFFRWQSGLGGYFLTYRNGVYRLKKSNNNNSNATGQVAIASMSHATRAITIRCVGDSVKVDIGNDGTWDLEYKDPSPLTGTAKGFYKNGRYDDNCQFLNATWSEIILATEPTLSSTSHSSVSCNTASSGGTTISNGGGTISAKGVCWSTSANPTTADSKTDEFVGDPTENDYSSSITGLSPNTTYYYRAYATNEAGTGYGGESSFLTLPVTVAGTIGTAQTICHGATPATLTNIASPTGGSGAYTYQWQSSPDNSAWSDIGSATAITYSPGALTTNTYYRRGETSSDCGTVYTASILITINPATVGGSITSSATVCSGANGATLTLSGHTGSIVRWESSTDNWVTPVTIANTTTTQAYSNITTTTKYRAVLKSGVCAELNSADVTITVDPTSVGGSIATAAVVCSGTNGATLTLSGNSGSITRWESSIDNWVTPVVIANTTSTQVYSNLTNTTKYRAVITSGTCPSVNSSEVEITVVPPLDPGVIGF